MLLGATLLVRSGETSSALVNEVHQLWGPPLDQAAPCRAVHRAATARGAAHRSTTRTGDRTRPTVQTKEEVSFPLPLVSTRARVSLALEHRQKGLLWFPTYAADFEGRYVVLNDTAANRSVTVSFPLPARGADLRRLRGPGREGPAHPRRGRRWLGALDGRARPARRAMHSRSATARAGPPPGPTGPAAAGQLGDPGLLARDPEQRARHRLLPGSISPSSAGADGHGWRGTWEFRSLVGSAPISLELPQKTNPGPLAARITFFAPVALLFYFFVVGLLAEGRGHRLHPLSWFLIGCAFFADHLLFAYLADHVPLWVALALSSAVSILLAVTYAQWLVGWRFALREMGLAQLVYLVGFSLTFLLRASPG